MDKLIVGGGIANTFLKAAGYEVGKSLYEPDLVESAAKIMEEAKGAARPSRCPSTSLSARRWKNTLRRPCSRSRKCALTT